MAAMSADERVKMLTRRMSETNDMLHALRLSMDPDEVKDKTRY